MKQGNGKNTYCTAYIYLYLYNQQTKKKPRYKFNVEQYNSIGYHEEMKILHKNV